MKTELPDLHIYKKKSVHVCAHAALAPLQVCGYFMLKLRRFVTSVAATPPGVFPRDPIRGECKKRLGARLVF